MNQVIDDLEKLFDAEFPTSILCSTSDVNVITAGDAATVRASFRAERQPLGSGRDGLEANRMLAAVYLSAKENRPVKIDEVVS